ncbi:MAG: VCBS repeat-containing protein, partial [Planctomycetota bacterium]|nr:VCBS repeat-containing protein [Planctomycetota bacterium]
MTSPITNPFLSCSTSLGSFSSPSVRGLLALAPAALVVSTALGQDFGTEQVVSTNAAWAESVHAVDLDGDGDADMLSASGDDNKIAWYENTDGLGGFGVEQVITLNANYAVFVYAADLDGDGDADVLSASKNDDKIAWYENRLNELTSDFGPEQVITTSADGAWSVYATDLDCDGDMDVLSASRYDKKIAWYENANGLGAFLPEQVITTNADWAHCVYAADLDGDGDADVLSASMMDDKIAWYENLGCNAGVITSFGSEQVITLDADEAQFVRAADLDGDGDVDVISASSGDDEIAWYENQGGGVFGVQQVITTVADKAESVHAADLDCDGDMDVLSASMGDATIAWYENTDGLGSFGLQEVITTGANGAQSVYATDLDGDGDVDVLAGSLADNKVAWFENLMCSCTSKYCTVADGSINNTTLLDASGCDLNWPITLDLSNGPPKQFTMLLIGSGTATITNPGSSQGDL